MGGLSTYVGESISFLENIYDEVDLVKMEIGNFDSFFEGVKEVMESLSELEPPKKRPKYDWGLKQQQWRHCYKKKFDKNLRDLYVAKFDFLPNSNIDLESLHSSRFLSDLTAISRNRAFVHHSHVSGKIIGFAHD